MWMAAREACLFGRTDLSVKDLVSKWRADAELALAYAQADTMLASKGALTHVAGAQFFPISRMVRPSCAASGEAVELAVPD